MRFFFLALALVGCAQSPPPTSPTPTPPPGATASPTPSSAPLVTPPQPSAGGSSGAIVGVPSRRRTTKVDLAQPAQPQGNAPGELVDPSEVPLPYRGQKVYRIREKDHVILKTEQGIILSITPLKN